MTTLKLMTTAELIEELQKYPPDMPVVKLTPACDCNSQEDNMTRQDLLVERWSASVNIPGSWNSRHCSPSDPKGVDVLVIG